MIVFPILFFLWIYSPQTLGMKQYLYYNEVEGNTGPVYDYMMDDGSGGEDKSDTDTLDVGFIVRGDGARIVEFYAPWCGHCVHFKPQFIKIANRVHSHPFGENVMFHAISCAAHAKICNHYNIHGYPSVFGLKDGQTNVGEEQLDRSKIGDVGYLLDQLGVMDGKVKDSEEEQDHYKEKDVKPKNLKQPDQKASIPSYTPHDQSTIYKDAATSFQYTLQNSIYMSNGPLSKDKAVALQKWIRLLYMTLPHDDDTSEFNTTWEQLKILRSKFNTAITSKDEMLKLLGLEKEAGSEWSTCRMDNDQFGYTCGLWNLFHIITVGYAEHDDDNGTHHPKDAPPPIQSEVKASIILRNYIDYFFSCRECREHFLKGYDDCAHDVCHRFETTGESNSSSSSNSQELALWLWEVHNGVNVRLLHELFDREEKGRRPSLEEEERVLWPSRDMCRDCWLEGEGGDGVVWDKEVVYRFLKMTYWPNNETIGENKSHHLSTQNKRISPKITFMTPIYLLGIAAFLWYLVKKREKDEVGRRKKLDFSIVQDVDKLIL